MMQVVLPFFITQPALVLLSTHTSFRAARAIVEAIGETVRSRVWVRGLAAGVSRAKVAAERTSTPTSIRGRTKSCGVVSCIVGVASMLISDDFGSIAFTSCAARLTFARASGAGGNSTASISRGAILTMVINCLVTARDAEVIGGNTQTQKTCSTADTKTKGSNRLVLATNCENAKPPALVSG